MKNRNHKTDIESLQGSICLPADIKTEILRYRIEEKAAVW